MVQLGFCHPCFFASLWAHMKVLQGAKESGGLWGQQRGPWSLTHEVRTPVPATSSQPELEPCLVLIEPQFSHLQNDNCLASLNAECISARISRNAHSNPLRWTLSPTFR